MATSPFTSPLQLPQGIYTGPLHDEPFDSFFPLFESAEFHVTSPGPGFSQALNMPQDQPANQRIDERPVSPEHPSGHRAINANVAPYTISGLSLDANTFVTPTSPIAQMPPFTSHPSRPSFPAMASSPGTFAYSISHRVHPYHAHISMNTPRFAQPLRPSCIRPVSLSPTGSSFPQQYYPAQAISPSVISPSSAQGSTFSDITHSPVSISVRSLPSSPSMLLTGLSKQDMSSPGTQALMKPAKRLTAPPGLLAQGQAASQEGASIRKMRPGPLRHHTMEPVVKMEMSESDSVSELDSFEEEESKPKKRETTSSSAACETTDYRTPAAKHDDHRKSRIRSEQKRRDELRKGFAKLRHQLPASTLRPSKASILERAVIHIQAIELAKNRLERQDMALQAEVMQLRASNTDLVHALTQVSRTTKGS